MKIHDFVDEGLGHSSYLIDVGNGAVALVDPPRFPTVHEALAAELGLRIEWTFDTHSHADYVTGSPGVAARLGATFVGPASSHLATPHRPLNDGEFIAIGPGLRVFAIATPGHTPDHHSYLIQQSGEPVALFSGGSLMVGAIGRTDLCGPERADELAHDMFRSLRRFDDLPDDLAVYPTHGAGSFCSAPGSSQRTTTLGQERVTNSLFASTDESEFVALLLGGFGTFPTYFARLPELNRLGPTRHDTLPDLARLDAGQVQEHLAKGGAVVDVRPVKSFAAGHIPGSMSNTLRPVFASWLGWLVTAGQPIVFVLDQDQDRSEVVRQSLDVGHERLVGELAGGTDPWAASGRPLATIELVAPTKLNGRVVDVRQANEYAAGHLPGAVNVELGSITTSDLPAGTLTIMCGHGERAMTAASLIAAKGRHDLVVLDGGPDTWSTATQIPLETGR